MKNDPVADLWLQNRQSSWYNHTRDAVQPPDAFRLAVEGLPDGRYGVESWETWKGESVRTDQIEVRDGLPPWTIPVLKTDAAVKIRAR